MLFSLIPIALISFFGTPELLAQIKPVQQVVASHTISLEKRYDNAFVNDVFKDNILLNLAYLENRVKSTEKIDWNEVEKPSHFELKLEKNELFAFHEDVLPEYSGLKSTTSHAHFNSSEGFKSDGYLVGDGICHFASLIYWAAKDAGLDAKAPTNHDFAKINEIPAEYGVAIYYMPGAKEASAQQNLYIKNSKDKSITFAFDYDGENLSVSVLDK